MPRDEIRHDDGNGFTVVWESTVPDPDVDAAFARLREQGREDTRAKAAALRRRLAGIRRQQRRQAA